MLKRSALALASGDVFYGYSFGAEGESYGEAVFNTSMSGYQEILTDPSYKGQIIGMTYPEIGNYGVCPEDNESSKIHAAGFVVHHYSKIGKHHRATGTLADFLISHKIVAIEGVDTRRLTRILRDKGNQKAVISTIDLDEKSLISKAQNSASIENIDLIKEVSTPEPYDWPMPSGVKATCKVAVYDYGVKWNILRSLAERGANLRVFPASTPAKEVLKWKPDGVFLSNGPGDPSAVPYAVQNVQDLLGQKPVFGICFGHQILGQAYGVSTYKLKFGHRGGNQPVKRVKNGKIEITSQNHGFSVRANEAGDVKKFPYLLTHLNANDQTLEGLENKKDFAFSVQYHPEASPGPHDSLYLFDEFIEDISEFKKKKAAEKK
jgi:carbamoyl-phosphate synthase small subunit